MKGVASSNDVLVGITEILVQLAGDLAKSKVLQSANADAAKGAFANQNGTLSINLDPKNWAASFATAAAAPVKPVTPTIIGLGDTLNAILANISAGLEAATPTYGWILRTAKQLSTDLLAQVNAITKAQFVLTSGDLSGASAAEAYAKAPDGTSLAGGALLVGQDGQGTITGSDMGRDILIGGANVITGKGGSLILTSNGKESFSLDGSDKINGKISQNRILAGAEALQDSFTYLSDKGSDLIVGNASGGNTFTFTNADKAAFTAIYGGLGGNNTYDIHADPAKPVRILILNAAGIQQGNIADFDMAACKKYVQDHYYMAASYYDPAIPIPTLVILNPGPTDVLKYNDQLVDTPSIIKLQQHTEHIEHGFFDPTPAFAAVDDAANHPATYFGYRVVDGLNPRKYVDGYGLGDIAIEEGLRDGTMHLALEGKNGYESQDTTLTTNGLVSRDLKYTMEGGSLSPILVLNQIRYTHDLTGYDNTVSYPVDHVTDLTLVADKYAGGIFANRGAPGLSILNFRSGDFGIKLPVSGDENILESQNTEFDVLDGWAKAHEYTYTANVAGLPRPINSVTGITPLKLGQQIKDGAAGPDTVQVTRNDYAAEMYDSLPAAPTIDINDFLIPDPNKNGSPQIASAGNNNFNGYSGSNSVSYSGAAAGVYASLADGTGYQSGSGQDFTGGGATITATDTYSGITNVIGSDHDDVLVGGSSGNLLEGGAGSDVLFGMGGNDTLTGGAASAGSYNQLWGGDGSDTASYVGTTRGIYASVEGSGGFVKDTGGAYVLTDAYNSIENLIGGSGVDVLVGDGGNNVLEGGAGADQLYGRGGADIFVYRSYADSNVPGGYDTIADFQTGIDKIDLTAFHTSAAHIVITSGPASTKFWLEAAPGTFNKATDLAISLIGANAVGVGDVMF